MSRVAVIRVRNGESDQGFNVSLQVCSDNALPSPEILGKLPANPELEDLYTVWQQTFIRLTTQRGTISDWQIESRPTNYSTSEVDACRYFVRNLETSMKNWLQHSQDRGWQKIRERLVKELTTNKSDEFRVVITAINPEMCKLPWHIWDLIESNPDVEIAFSYLNDGEPEPTQANYNNQVRILAVLGDTNGINTQPDRDAIRRLDGAKPEFLLQPTSRELIQNLRRPEGWDIFFFAGHSETNDEIGRIYINESESLEISDFRNALREAIHHGLKLAIFNSCDGLGLAQQLADLHIPVIIVMREPVPDEVAQSFLREFLTEYAHGQPLYTSVRRARERLEEFQNLPGATWLPVICQNPALVPPTWQELRHPKRKGQILPNRLRLITVLLLSVVVAAFAQWVKTSIFEGRNPLLGQNAGQVRNNIVKNKINGIYQEVLGRDAEPAAIARHTSALAEGITLSEIRRQIASSEEAKNKINSIYQEVLGRDAEPVAIAGRTNDLAKGLTLSEIRSQTASSQEATNKINSIYQEVFKRNAETYELKSQVALLAEGATLSLIRVGIARTSSLLQNGNVISLQCLGHLSGSNFLDGRAGNKPVALTAMTDGQSTSTKWRIHVISDGVIALENQGKIPGSTWLNGLTYAETVNLAPNIKHPHTGTKWRIHVISDGVIALENQGHIRGSTWLNGVTAGRQINLVSYPNELFTGIKWRIIKQ